MKKRFFIGMIVALALILTASLSQERIKINERKMQPIEVVTATYMSTQEDEGKIYLVVQRIGLDGKEHWLVSQKILDKLVKYGRYQFTIQGYPGGYTILNTTPITTD